ncbi:DUF4886 domain-containing protein [Maribellus sp. YY47]|uniref:DUF4886 domain-containing protein n=1 Tax=Maribellus sp. YY47 TaxID=2929486 RepID=UPI002000749D|nr:DUF4886 domain-containing protein [Maribellus sp. YY47]MCK3685626.1 DUF4886 domain-containing protein [Maribellus sp. YY47]
MMRQIKSLVLLIFFSAFAFSVKPSLALTINNKSVSDTLKVLTIGNSFADNACHFLSEITQSVEGCNILIQKANLGGCSLDRHAGLIEKSEQDPSTKPYNGKSLKELLQSNNWDVVTIQQVSGNSFRKETYQPYADKIVDYVKKYAPHSRVYIHQTWPYAPDCKRLEEYDISFKEMYKKLNKNYKTLAKRYDATRLESGDAFYLAHKKNGDVDLWSPSDRYHASPNGCYLAGCVWFSQLFGVSPEKITFVPKDMPAETAQFLRKIASK